MTKKGHSITEEQAVQFMKKIGEVVEQTFNEIDADFPTAMFYLLSTFSFICLESFKTVEDAKCFINTSISSAFKSFAEMNKMEKERS